MNAKIGIMTIVLLLSWATVGGCPTPGDVADGAATSDADGSDGSISDGTSPADDAGNDADNGAPGGATGGAPTTDGDATDDGSGDGSSADDEQTNGASGDNGSDGGEAGDGDSGDGSGSNGESTPSAFEGTFSGDLTCVKRESLGGPLGLEEEWTTDFSITFNDQSIPTGFAIPYYRQSDGSIDFLAEVNELGEFTTLNETLVRPQGEFFVTLDVTVTLATYGETTARVVLDLVHHGDFGVDENGDPENPFATEDGTGVQVVEYHLEGEQLVYSSLTTYEVQLFNGTIDTIWEVSCEGTLSPE